MTQWRGGARPFDPQARILGEVRASALGERGRDPGAPVDCGVERWRLEADGADEAAVGGESGVHRDHLLKI